MNYQEVQQRIENIKLKTEMKTYDNININKNLM